MTETITFNILTYNVFAFTKWIESTAQNQRLSLITDKIKLLDDTTEGGVDIISLNEFWDNTERGMVVEKMRLNGYKYTSNILPRHPLKLLNGGVQIFSKHKITAVDWVTYDDCASEDCLASKGAMYIRIIKSSPSGNSCLPFNILGSHLNVGNSGNNTLTGVQFSQIEQLTSFMHKRKSRLSATEPFVIAGDLNVDKFESTESGNDFNKLLETLDESVDLSTLLYTKSNMNTVDRDGPNPDGETKYLDYILWNDYLPETSLFENVNNEFQPLEPLYNTPYCPGEWGRGYLKADCKLNHDRVLEDLSDHDPIFGQFKFSVNDGASCGDIEETGMDGFLMFWNGTFRYIEHFLLIVFALSFMRFAWKRITKVGGNSIGLVTILLLWIIFMLEYCLVKEIAVFLLECSLSITSSMEVIIMVLIAIGSAILLTVECKGKIFPSKTAEYELFRDSINIPDEAAGSV